MFEVVVVLTYTVQRKLVVTHLKMSINHNKWTDYIHNYVKVKVGQDHVAGDKTSNLNVIHILIIKMDY